MKKNNLLVLDTSYSYEDITKRGLQKSVTCRDLNGYFDHVYSVHPFASIVTTQEWASKYGKPQTYRINQRHTFIEGKIGRFSYLKNIFPINFLIGQIGLIYNLRKLIKTNHVKIIRVGDMLYLGILGWILSKLCRVPFIVRVGGNNDKVYESTGQPIQKRLFFNRRNEKAVERFIFKRAHLVAAANEDNLEFAINNGARKEYSTVFRYGNLLADEHFIEPQSRKEGDSLLEELGLEANSFLLCIGRLEQVKLPDHVIEVLSILKKRGHDIKALMVGDGTMLKELLEKAKELDIDKDVVFVGNKDQDWLSRVLPLARVVMSPITGRALSEAAFASVPVVAYDVDWQKELIQNEKTGLLVEFKNILKFSEATEKFLLNNEFSKKMAKNLRLKALDILDPKKLDAHEIKEYEKLKERYYKKNTK